MNQIQKNYDNNMRRNMDIKKLKKELKKLRRRLKKNTNKNDIEESKYLEQVNAYNLLHKQNLNDVNKQLQNLHDILKKIDMNYKMNNNISNYKNE